MVDYNSMKVTELKAELTARGLSTKGLKKELVARMEESVAAEGTAGTTTTTEPDVAPKVVGQELQEPESLPTAQADKEATEAEAKVIAHVAEPVEEPTSAPAEADIVMAPVPAPAPVTDLAPVLEPVVGTPTLVQEGLVDTTADVTSSSRVSLTVTESEPTKKRSLDDETDQDVEGAKKLRTEDKQDPELNAAGARRRSAAPSPSPAPIRPATMDIPAPFTEPSSAGSPTEERKMNGPPSRRFDVRSLMEKQVKLAFLDRQPEKAASAIALSTHHETIESESPNAQDAEKVAIDESMPKDSDTTESAPTDITRALVITNFVRPLTVNQVKRMLAAFGEVETLWMDSIRTHCYVIFKEASAAKKAFSQVKGQVFPKETGRPLEPHFITPEAATSSIEAAEEAQKNGKKPLIFTGKETIVAEAKRTAPIKIQRTEAEDLFRQEIEAAQAQTQVVQPKDLFKMTVTEPALYYKPVKEPPTVPLAMEI